MHGEDSVKLFVGSLHARDLNMAASIARVAAHNQTVSYCMGRAPQCRTAAPGSCLPGNHHDADSRRNIYSQVARHPAVSDRTCRMPQV